MAGSSHPKGLQMLARVAFLMCGLIALPAVATAQEDARAVANAYSIMLERQFMSWHIWTTGVSRLDDGTLFGLISILLAMSFGVSGIGIILFQEKGLGFRGGWMLSIPVILSTMIGYTIVRPYPSVQDVPTMLVASALAALMALFIARLTKVSVAEAVERPAHKADVAKAAADRRLRMATRAPVGKRGY